ncbi:MAG: amino acid ABC transporter substrate-binding protein [Candidatus Electrothrix sp. MAN1_4]|nr:amino acid ABC transporter substrate-binding protein [Candidatus Electrothrix sp. MAN1_4]
MKKKIIIVISGIIFGAGIYFFTQSPYMSQKEPVYIAVVGPMGEANGKAMRQGVKLYKDQINQQGGLDGRKLEILFRDDQNREDIAEDIAWKLAEENKVHVVLGHYYSSTSISAGTVYKRNGIPAITASANAESVIRDNEWYFRTIPGNALEAQFTASYMYDILNKYREISLSEIVQKTIPASIIFSKDEYGLSLLENFEHIAQQFDIEIQRKWEWDDEKSSTEQVERIKNELAEIDNPGIIYFATHAAEGVQIITALKDDGRNEGKTYPMIVSTAVARSFFDKLKSYAKEWETPGYYSDGIYFVTPFMLSLSGVKGFEFAQQFIKKYKKKPGVVASCYYDAVHVAVQAMKKSGIHGKKYIREDRRNIRTALSKFYNEDKGVKGVTGLIWFDRTGGVKREYAVGRWLKQKALPAFVQYYQYNENIDNIMLRYLEGDVEIVEDLTMSSTQIVHVTVEYVKLIDIDKKKSEFSAEFRLRFRYPDYFDIFQTTSGKTQITSVICPLEFTNALSPIVLGEPVQEEMIGEDVVSKAFQVQGRFRADFESGGSFLSRKKQELFIRFRHADQLYDNLIYIPGITEKQNKQVSDGRSPAYFSCYSDILSKKTTLGNPKNFDSDFRLNYSRFNIVIRR